MGQRWPLRISLNWSLCWFTASLGPLAQGPVAPSSNSFTSNYFKHSPNNHLTLNHMELATSAHHREDNPCLWKMPNYCCPSELCDPETPLLGAESHRLESKCLPLQEVPHSIPLRGDSHVLLSLAGFLLRRTSLMQSLPWSAQKYLNSPNVLSRLIHKPLIIYFMFLF